MNEITAESKARAEALAVEVWGPKRRLYPIPAPAVVAEPSQPTDLRWRVMTTEPNRETTACAGLVGRRFEAYCPTFRKKVRQNYFRRRFVTRAMFPGYVFVLFESDRGNEGRVLSTPGITGFLQLEPDAVAILSFLDIHKMRKTEARLEAQLSMKVGDTVEIDFPEWQGHLGKISALLHDDRARIEVLFEMLGRETRVVVSSDQLRTV